jgi:hypothetical protein
MKQESRLYIIAPPRQLNRWVPVNVYFSAALFLVFTLLGVVGIGYGIYALRRNWRAHVNQNLHTSRTVIVLLLIGFVVGAATWPATGFMRYPMRTEDGIGWAVGFPFIVAYFDPGGADFVGLFTMPAVVGNFFFWFLLPQTILYWVWKRRR